MENLGAPDRSLVTCVVIGPSGPHDAQGLIRSSKYFQLKTSLHPHLLFYARLSQIGKYKLQVHKSIVASRQKKQWIAAGNTQEESSRHFFKL